MITKEEENKICMNCAKCCKVYWIFTDVPEEVERFKTLDRGITVEKVKSGLWKIIFNEWCKHLNKKESKYFCKIYDKVRPKYCPEYPRNFLSKGQDKDVLEHEKKFCPLLKRITGS